MKWLDNFRYKRIQELRARELMREMKDSPSQKSGLSKKIADIQLGIREDLERNFPEWKK